MEANGIKQNFPQDFQDLPDNDLIGYFFGSRQGDLKNFRISAQKVADSLGIISLGGAPIYFEGNQLPTLNNTDEPVKKGDWTNLSANQTYLNINGGSNIETPDDRWSIGVFNGSSWSLKDMGALPSQPVSDQVLDNTGAVTGVGVGAYAASKSELEQITNPTGDKAGTLKNGYSIRKSDGQSIVTSGWLHSSFVPVSDNSKVTRIGVQITPGSSMTVGIIAFYDKDKVFLGVVDQATMTIPATFSFVVSSYFPDAKFIICSSSISVGLQVQVQTPLNSASIDGLPEMMAQQPSLFETTDFALTANNGYWDASGNIISSPNWRYTSRIKVSSGQKVKRRGITSGNAIAVLGWNQDLSSTIVIAGVVASNAEVTYTIPDGVFYVGGSARMTGGDIFQFIIDVAVSTLNSIQLEKVENSSEYKTYMPKFSYGKQGVRSTFNPKGIISKRGLDVIWNMQYGNQEYLSLTPSNVSDVSIELKYRNIFEEIKSAGISTLKVSPNVAVNPSAMHYFLPIGDSTTLGEQASGIKAAWPNECSRRLTGVGTALMSGAESPAALSLTNISFIGTIGDQPIKCEGRGGWGYNNYLNNESVSGITNVFWNPSTNLFDLDYYLTQNGFTGVNATGSNLTIVIQLGWNHVYTHTLAQVETWCKQLIDLIHSAKPNAKVKILGLATPPELNDKQYAGNRNVSAESIMNEAIITYAELYDKIANLSAYSSFVEYVHIAHQFFADNSFPMATAQRTVRDSNTLNVYTDYVHPNARGYAQIADILFYNILYNYCR